MGKITKNRKIEKEGETEDKIAISCAGGKREFKQNMKKTICLNCLKKQPPGQFCLREGVREKGGVGSIKGSRKPPEQNTWRQY